ncbi:formylmethanofuran dehydrogenase subunit C [Rivibacter subsaxonicus]|uniref:Formylmethanofuran dehydrogenase subunit C n=1 Tax=Rivibacter subsaxonicus TaxID=457575 RepID=A0A4Q7W1J2_9BURK|nr:formylmethanofuran dehydrogenase subunit C [Rivibacter subsaxonicus]RZU02705.1 formylmethanofuran dehydrogenase subunit C [Rivibacter subsaxonicus]
MSGWQLTLKQTPTLRLDLRRVAPLALAALDAAGVAAIELWHGNERGALGDWFDIAAIDTDGELLVRGDLSRCDRIGQGMAGGRLEVEGSVGDWFAAGLAGGEVHLCGNAGRLAACAMQGGELSVQGDLGDHGCGALPGDMDGLRGGTVVVHGSVGARFGDRMRRGTVLIGGDAGDFLASRMVAGTIALAGRCGAHPGYLQRRGSLVFAGAQPEAPASFVPAHGEATVAGQLLAREIARLAHHHGLDEAFATLAARRSTRLRGDLAVDGRGEWWLAGS